MKSAEVEKLQKEVAALKQNRVAPPKHAKKYLI